MISYEDLIGRVLSEAEGSSWGGPQYKSAVWAQDAEQLAAAKRQASHLGKQSVPVYSERALWHDAEEYHQKYFEKAGRFQGF